MAKILMKHIPGKSSPKQQAKITNEWYSLCVEHYASECDIKIIINSEIKNEQVASNSKKTKNLFRSK